MRNSILYSVLIAGTFLISGISFAQNNCGSPLALTPGTQQCGTNNLGNSFPNNGTAPTNPCDANYNDGEYWFTYTGTGMALDLDVTGLSATYSGLFVFDACPGSSPNCIASYTSGFSTANFSVSTPALTLGQVYYIAMVNYAAPASTNFCLDATVVAPPVVNNCGSPVPLTPGTQQCATNNNTGSFPNGGGAPTNPCDAFYNDGEYWFSYTGTGMALDLDVSALTDNYSGLFVFDACPGSSPNCIASYESGFSTANFSVLTPALTLGQVYYIVIINWGTPDFTDFCLDATITAPPVTPPNDDPCGAIAIPVEPSCIPIGYDNIGTTNTTSAPNPGCAGGATAEDIWFTVTVPPSGALAFDSDIGTITDGGMAIYSGTCGALTLIDCDDDASANGFMPMITASGLTPGATIWINFWELGGGTGTFDLCVYETAAPPPLPGNVTCAGMEPICSNTPITFTAATGGTAASVANPGNNYGCLSTSPNPTWFYMQMLTSGVMAINMSAGSDIDFAMWGPFPNLANAQANCNSMGPPIDCSYSTSATEQANLPAAAAGQVYVLLVTNYANVSQIIDLNTAAGNTATTDCTIILPIDLVNIFATVEHSSNTLHWTTMSETSNDLFVVERSYNGTFFDEIGTIDGSGNSSIAKDYEFVDRNFSANLVYYRLKQIDFDGVSQLSNIVTVNRDLETVLIFPNPTTSSITINFPVNQTGNFTIKYTDVIGKEYTETCELDGTIKSFSSQIFNEVPAGIYFVEIRNQDGTLISVQRIVKSK